MKLAYADTETTGTNSAIHEVWEMAVVLEEDGRVVDRINTFVQPMRLEWADAKALEIGGFYQRFPRDPIFQMEPTDTVADCVLAATNAGEWLSRHLRGYRLASCNIDFDASFLRALTLGDRPGGGWPVTWHYSPLDVKSICYGAAPATFGMKTDELIEYFELHEFVRKPGEHHTAADDAELARALLHAALRYSCELHPGPYSAQAQLERLLAR